MELMNEQQHRNWTVILTGFMVLSAVWAAWNRNAPAIVGSLGLGLALPLFYFARKSSRPQVLRWTAFACSMLSLVAMLFRSIISIIERNG